MMRKWLLLVLLAVTGSAGAVELRTTIWPPYQLMLRGELSGVSMTTLNCIFSDMGKPFSVKVMPWGRAIADLKGGDADGLFSSLPTRELESYATMSAPFALEKWYWYYSDSVNYSEEDFPAGLRVGAVRASNQARWLQDGGVKVEEEVNEGKQLLRLVAAERLDAFVADERYFQELLSEVDDNERARLSKMKRRFIRYMPLGVYFGDHFLSEHPTFMGDFNQRIGECADESIKLNTNERQQIVAIHEYHMRQLLQHPEIVRILEWQNREHVNITQDEIEALDKQWIYEMHQDVRPMINAELNRDISRFLRKIQDDSKGLFTEIFLVERCGLNAGQSTVTSDFYQGDETPFKSTMGSKNNDLYIGPIEYDASSASFQVKVSSVVYNGHNQAIGMMTFGVDVEKALRQSQ